MLSQRWVYVLLAIACFQTVFASSSKDTYHRSFWQPYYHGERLSYCSIDHQQCGQPIANAYCQTMGYEKADQIIIAHNVGLTNYFNTQAHCKGWSCDGFKTIRCVNQLKHQPPKAYHYRLKQFVLPRYNHYRVDWCYDGSEQCGRKAAFSFCRRMGYMDVKTYQIEKNVEATQAIGNQKLCFGRTCQSFSTIVCFR